ncbi:glycosyltransferase family 39 protein [Gramella jeungdoensis]|uniref:Glycosyltransferase family 39 protein n=1 Tax=Gramella jeungdoensis TaxID=708091 RepID=A0ABT0Z0D0_9FLAO|nr:glycosyltransferase family 39 protein [Gramella jeungdoensis]MCM8569183.1 glycosyltransferase family 39 protein [Gramella jeungdoensis]
MSRIKTLIIIGLSFVILTVLGYNFHVANSLKYDFGGDASDFIHLGLTLAKTGKYGHLDLSHTDLVQGFKNGNHKTKTYKFSGHSTWRPPIWPAIIAFCFLISGYSLGFLVAFKILLHLLGGLFFYKTLEYFTKRVIFIYAGVFLYLVNPAWQIYSRVFLSEPITLFFMTLFIWSLVRYLKEGKLLWANGIFGGILILAHPYYIFLPFSLWFFLFLYKRVSLKNTLLLAIFTVCIVSIWVIRNYIILDGNKAVITTSSGAVMAKGWNQDVPDLHTNTKGDLADESLVLQTFDYDKSDYRGEVGGMMLYRDATINFIKSNPDLILPIIFKKLKSAFNPFPETPRPGILETGRVIFQVLALVAALFLLLRGSIITKAMVLGLFLSTALITIITYSGFRFRMPQTSLEIMFIILAVNFLIQKYRAVQIKPE